jgi:hypothetical protein
MRQALMAASSHRSSLSSGRQKLFEGLATALIEKKLKVLYGICKLQHRPWTLQHDIMFTRESLKGVADRLLASVNISSELDMSVTDIITNFYKMVLLTMCDTASASAASDVVIICMAEIVTAFMLLNPTYELLNDKRSAEPIIEFLNETKLVGMLLSSAQIPCKSSLIIANLLEGYDGKHDSVNSAELATELARLKTTQALHMAQKAADINALKKTFTEADAKSDASIKEISNQLRLAESHARNTDQETTVLREKLAAMQAERDAAIAKAEKLMKTTDAESAASMAKKDVSIKEISDQLRLAESHARNTDQETTVLREKLAAMQAERDAAVSDSASLKRKIAEDRVSADAESEAKMAQKDARIRANEDEQQKLVHQVAQLQYQTTVLRADIANKQNNIRDLTENNATLLENAEIAKVGHTNEMKIATLYHTEEVESIMKTFNDKIAMLTSENVQLKNYKQQAVGTPPSAEAQ